MPRSNSALLRDFHARRDAGDTAGAKAVWGELVVANYDRMAGFAAAFRTAGGHLTVQEQEDAVQEAFMRIWNRLGTTLVGRSEGEFMMAMRTAVRFACQDVLKAKIRRREREATSLDEVRGADDGSLVDDVDPDVLTALLDHQHTAEARRDAERDVYGALDRLDNDGYREVLVHTLAGTPTEELLETLGITRDNLYQRRKRGLAELRRILTEGGSPA